MAEDLCARAYEGAEESRVTGPTENIGLNLKLVVKVRKTWHTRRRHWRGDEDGSVRTKIVCRVRGG